MHKNIFEYEDSTQVSSKGTIRINAHAGSEQIISLYMLAASLVGMWQVHCASKPKALPYLTLTQLSLLIIRAASRRPAAKRM